MEERCASFQARESGVCILVVVGASSTTSMQPGHVQYCLCKPCKAQNKPLIDSFRKHETCYWLLWQCVLTFLASARTVLHQETATVTQAMPTILVLVRMRQNKALESTLVYLHRDYKEMGSLHWCWDFAKYIPLRSATACEKFCMVL